jgi:hypothetical protein
MNSFYNNYQEKQEQQRQTIEKKERSFGQQMYPVSIAGNLAKMIIHVFSFSAAVILPAYGFEILFGSFYIGLIVGFIFILVFIEIPKWSVIDTIFENYFDSQIISYGLAMFAVCLIAPSVASSTFGVPILVNRLSPAAETLNLSEIEQKFDNQKRDALSFYTPQIKKHNQDAIKYFTAFKKKDRVSGEWRLSSSPKVKQPYNDMLKAEKEAQRALNNRLDSIQVKKESALSVASNENKSTIQKHNFKKNHAGNIAFWVMLLLEFCYVLIVWGLKYYEYRSKQERTGIEPNQDEQTQIVPIRTESKQPEQKRPVEKQAVAAKKKIGFDSEQSEHGKIFIPVGATKERVKYKKEDGTFTEYTKADLVRMSKRSTGTEEYKAELERLINKFKN